MKTPGISIVKKKFTILPFVLPVYIVHINAILGDLLLSWWLLYMNEIAYFRF